MQAFSLIAPALLAAGLAVGAPAQADPDPKVLRVCADPNNMPLSDQAGNGYENRIAELLGEELGRKVEYTYMPQRMGFIRNTLRASNGQGGFKCDLIIGVPDDYDMTSNTRPYLHSTWVMIVRDTPELAGVKSPDDVLALPAATRSKLRFGTFTHSPPLDWLFKHQMFDQAVMYKTLSADPEEFPGRMVQSDLVAGKIDVAMVWGPIGGYFAKRASVPLRIIPFMSSPDLKFDYQLAMGVRVPEKQWRTTIDAAVARRQADIDRILTEYGVPLLALPAPKVAQPAPEKPGGAS